MPAPRATLAALAVALLLVLIPAVSAYEEVFEIDERLDDSFSIGNREYRSTSYFNKLYFMSMQEYYGVYAITLKSSDTDPFTLTDPTKMYHSVSMQVKDGATVVTTGSISYNKNLVDNKYLITLTFDNPDAFYAYSGAKGFDLVYSGFNLVSVAGGYIGTIGAGKVGICSGYASSTFAKPGTYYVLCQQNFINKLQWSESDLYTDITIVRNLNGEVYTSKGEIWTDRAPYYNESSINDVSVRVFEQPITVRITSISGNVFTKVIGQASDTPSGPSTVPVNIVALDSRTGNLLLDAAVEVHNETGTLIASGSTSPNGWYPFTYQLPATLTDEDFEKFYAVNITLDGWTQKVEPYVFYPAFTPRTGDWIRVEMLPDSSGPADPENTYLMFYVRDTSGNGLQGAYVSIDGEYWSTNSAGHVAAEVAKNATYPYTVSKTGYMTISGSATVADASAYTVNVVLAAGELPTLTPGPTVPGATPTPDRRTNEEKGQSIIDMIADNAEPLAALALLGTFLGIFKLMAKW